MQKNKLVVIVIGISGKPIVFIYLGIEQDADFSEKQCRMGVPPTWLVSCCFDIHSLIPATSHCVYFLLIDDELFVLENIAVLDRTISPHVW